EPCDGAIVMSPKCERCDDTFWVCEAHDDKPVEHGATPRPCPYRAPGTGTRIATCATTRGTHQRCRRDPTYAINSVAAASSLRGIVRPKVFAVRRLTTNSNSFGCWTGKSAGLAPLRICPT